MRSLRLLCIKNLHILGLLLTVFASSHAMDKQKNIQPKHTKEIKIKFWRYLFKDMFLSSNNVIVSPCNPGNVIPFPYLTNHILEVAEQIKQQNQETK